MEIKVINFERLEPMKLWTNVTGEFALKLMMPKLKTRISSELDRYLYNFSKTKKAEMKECKLTNIFVSGFENFDADLRFTYLSLSKLHIFN